jgi:hypothetical protein
MGESHEEGHKRHKEDQGGIKEIRKDREEWKEALLNEDDV